MVTELDRGIGPIKQRDRGLTGGQLLMGMAAAQLVGQDCLAGLDRVRADAGSALLAEAAVAPSTTAGRLAGRFGPVQLAGIETAVACIYHRWLALVPGALRAGLVLRDPTIDLDASDVEVYGRTKRGVGWSYAGVRSGRVHLASWAQAELPMAAELMAGNDDVRPRVGGLLTRALAGLPAQVCGRPPGAGRRRLLRCRAGDHRCRVGLRLRDRGEAEPGCLAGVGGRPRRGLAGRPWHGRRAGRGLQRLGPPSRSICRPPQDTVMCKSIPMALWLSTGQ